MPPVNDKAMRLAALRELRQSSEAKQQSIEDKQAAIALRHRQQQRMLKAAKKKQQSQEAKCPRGRRRSLALDKQDHSVQRNKKLAKRQDEQHLQIWRKISDLMIREGGNASRLPRYDIFVKISVDRPE